MTREEAVNELNDRIKVAEYVNSDYIDCVSVDAVKMAISALSVPDTNVGDMIRRQAAIELMLAALDDDWEPDYAKDRMCELPSAQPEQHYCRECKWSRCHANVDKHGKCETYWRCLNWDGETDEEGYCHEWERRTDG